MLRRLVRALALATAGANPAASEDPAAVIFAYERDWAEAAVSKELTIIDGSLHERFRLVTLYGSTPGVAERAEHVDLQRAEPTWAFRSMTATPVDVDIRGPLAISTVSVEVEWPEGVSRPTDYLLPMSECGVTARGA